MTREDLNTRRVDCCGLCRNGTATYDNQTICEKLDDDGTPYNNYVSSFCICDFFNEE